MRVDTLNSIPPDLFYTVVYVLVSICLIHPPTEFVNAGLTVQNLFAAFLGSEQLHFVYHHMKRVSATVVFHSLLPLGYFFGYVFFINQFWMLNPYNFSKWSLFWQYFMLLAIILPICAGILTFFWSLKNYSFHPLARQLQTFAAERSTWRAVASSINVEFRRIDKFTTGLPGRRLIVTDSWIIKTSTYSVYVAHQTDVHLTVIAADEHEIAYDSPTGAQFLNINVADIHDRHKTFVIRLNSAEYQDLKDKLQAPIRSAQSVMIRQSVSDRFIAAFSDQAARNPRYKKPNDVEIEQCIGCMNQPSDCKLVKNCESGEGDQDCRNCYCRPMWCLECMARWFVNRQDQSKPETWMECKSPCPTCRTTFCMADVCIVEDS